MQIKRTVCGIGYLGDGQFIATDGKKATKCYEMWRGMLRRCYKPNSQKDKENYKNCYVCDEWHNYQNFAKWYSENIYEFNQEKMDLDKDLLIKDNKIYSPQTCLILPHNINSLLCKIKGSRGNLPLGVSQLKKNSYVVHCSTKFMNLTGNSTGYIGHFNNVNDAFQTYKEYKEKLVKYIADKYKNDLPIKVYNALYEYEVNIND